ncbi:MAG: NAD(P)-binding domain-containing protein [Acetobacteraceae bacterium]
MWQTDVVIIGAGQAGLAMSQRLLQREIRHVVIERGEVAERWRNERWDTLRLLTPNWMSRLPGWSYEGPDPDGFMTKHDYAGWLAGYAAAAALPVVTGTNVTAVRRLGTGYQVVTDHGTWHAQAVVIATGHCDVPLVPAMARQLPPDIHQVTTADYRNPAGLPDGGVLVVGASASGVQLAEEIRQSGREVAISVGRHMRLPRRYRGHDIMWWLDRLRVHAQGQPMDLAAARSQPSMQLVGRPAADNIDLRTLRDIGVRLLGRALGIEAGTLHLKDDVAETVGEAEARLQRLLGRIDAVADAYGAVMEVPPCGLASEGSPVTLDLAAAGIRTVVWATGFVRNYQWLHVPVLDAAGEIAHCGGVTSAPGLFVTGLRFLRRWNPSFIDAVSADAIELAAEVQRHLRHGIRAAA